MNNTLLSQAQQDKTAISSAAQRLRVAQAESESEKAKVKKLENELVSHRSNFQIIKTIEDLDKVSFSVLSLPSLLQICSTLHHPGKFCFARPSHKCNPLCVTNKPGYFVFYFLAVSCRGLQRKRR
jgi:hypothetical protein